MRIITATIIWLFLIMQCITAVAQDWKLSVDANLTLTQNTYSDNWVGGESGALSWTFNSNSLAEKQLSERIYNKNTMKLFFGQTHNQERETHVWRKPVKATDLIDLESVFRFTFGGFVEPFAAGRLESQLF